jgi:restriction system protein
MAKQERGPQFVRFFPHTIEALRQLGGAARPLEVCAKVAELAKISPKEQEETTSNGQSRFYNQVAWGRFYLAKAGLIDTSKYGVWTLTDVGRKSNLDQASSVALFKDVRTKLPAKENRETKTVIEGNLPEATVPENLVAHRVEILDLLQSLPPKGFENFSKRLLLAAGFQDVNVTGQSGDGGIDGAGILQINPLMSFKVLFQCKRYKGVVSSPQIRDFRGAMQGRADKGIIITTGTFTPDARKEAIRDGVPPIELVDGEKLIDMMEQLELGLKPVKAYEIDDGFFSEFHVK